MNFETLYSNIIGELVDNDKALNIYAPGQKCDLYYKRIYKLRETINEKLGAEEDEDLCELENLYDFICKEAANRVFDYCSQK